MQIFKEAIKNLKLKIERSALILTLSVAEGEGSHETNGAGFNGIHRFALNEPRAYVPVLIPPRAHSMCD